MFIENEMISQENISTNQRPDKQSDSFNTIIHPELKKLHTNVLKTKLVTEHELYEALTNDNKHRMTELSNYREHEIMPNRALGDSSNLYQIIIFSVIFLLCLIIGSPIVKYVIEQILGIRCFVPNNYLVWEATRPISDCSFCEGVTKPIILANLTSEEFLVKSLHAI